MLSGTDCWNFGAFGTNYRKFRVIWNRLWELRGHLELNVGTSVLFETDYGTFRVFWNRLWELPCHLELIMATLVSFGTDYGSFRVI